MLVFLKVPTFSLYNSTLKAGCMLENNGEFFKNPGPQPLIPASQLGEGELGEQGVSSAVYGFVFRYFKWFQCAARAEKHSSI